MNINKATLEDIKEIHDLIEKYSKQGLMLYRHTAEIERNIRDYFVVKEKNKLIGCCGLRTWDKKSSEIYALAVKETHMGKGIGTKLIKTAIKDAKKLKTPFIFTLTFRPNIFEKEGFKKINIKNLPKIIFTEKTVNIDKAYGLVI